MAKKVNKEAAKAAPAAKEAAKKTKMTPEEKAAKRKARMEAIKNRPAVQRPNSKQIDVIELANGSKVLNFAAPVRKHGSLVTSVALNADGEVVSTSVVMVEGVSPKSKKGHGYLVDKIPDVKEKEVEHGTTRETSFSKRSLISKKKSLCTLFPISGRSCSFGYKWDDLPWMQY